METFLQHLDEKIVAFLCATAIAISLILCGNTDAANVSTHIIAGMFGATVGRLQK